MRLDSLRIKNYKVLKDVEIDHIPPMAVFIGMNGVGKSTFLDVFAFLHEALNTNIRIALGNRGGFREVISRDQAGDIEFEFCFRSETDGSNLTYQLAIGMMGDQKPAVKKECLLVQQDEKQLPVTALEFNSGIGFVLKQNPESPEDFSLAEKKTYELDSQDILAIKGLGQFQEYAAVNQVRKQIEDWFISDFNAKEAKELKDAGFGDRLSQSGANLVHVAQFFQENHKKTFDKIMDKLGKIVPDLAGVEIHESIDGKVSMKYKDKNFSRAFDSHLISDGTVRALYYLFLLKDIKHHALLCVDNIEKEVYPAFLRELAESIRLYALNGGQVFVTMYSLDFLNAVAPEEIFYMSKKDGFASILTLSEKISELHKAGEALGDL